MFPVGHVDTLTTLPVELSAQPLNTLFANVTLVVVPLSVALHAGKLILLSLVHVNVTVCDDELTAVFLILPPVPPFAFNVIVFVFAVHRAVNVLPAVYVHFAAVPAVQFALPSFHPANVYPVFAQLLFAAGVKFVSYVAVPFDGAVPVAPLPHAYVTVYVLFALHAGVCVPLPAVPVELNVYVVFVPPFWLYDALLQFTLHTNALPLTLLTLVLLTPVPAVHVPPQFALIVLFAVHVCGLVVSHPVNTLLLFVRLFAVPLALLHAGNVTVFPW